MSATHERPTITAHCLVKNEENFVGTAIKSVLPHVDKLIIFDTGSQDATVNIIRDLIEESPEREKILFEEKGEIDVAGHTKLRNEMVEKTHTDWFMVLDGDEVWPEDQIKFFVEEDLIAAEQIGRGCILVNYHLVAGDLHHYTESGHFMAPWRLHGQFTFRAFRRVKGIFWRGEYNTDIPCYADGSPVPTQDNTFGSTTFFWHLSKLPRSSHDDEVFHRKKQSKAAFIPQPFKKYFYKKYPGSLPTIFDED